METPHVTADRSGDRDTTNPLKGFGCGGSGRFGSVLGGLTSCDSEDKGDPPEPRGTRRVCTQPIFLEKCGSIPPSQCHAFALIKSRPCSSTA